MRWDQNHRSSDVVDRRGQGGGAGLLGLIPLLIRSPLGLVGTLIVVGLYVGYRFFLGGGLGLSQDSAGGGQQTKDESIAFVSFVLDDVQKTWERKYPGGKYQKAKLVVFTGSTPSACGTGRASTGPFYCPADRNAYIDLSFYDALRKRLGAPGDFAQAYVIAHEIGHHVQNLMGTSAKVHAAPKSQQAGANGLSVRLELQADCYAGVWGHDTSQRKLLEEGDLEEALTAAAAIGDDRLQKQATGTVSPETFSHGTSAQRVKWFQRGYKSGDPAECDTFSVPAP
ncbi:MAG: neutral zinc metallopeptidase [Polyangiaceae bacterium]